MGLVRRKPDLHDNNKGTDQPGHLGSLISAFVIRFLENIMTPPARHSFNIVNSLRSRAGWFEPYLVVNPKDMFSHPKTHLKLSKCFCTIDMSQVLRKSKTVENEPLG